MGNISFQLSWNWNVFRYRTKLFSLCAKLSLSPAFSFKLSCLHSTNSSRDAASIILWGGVLFDVCIRYDDTVQWLHNKCTFAEKLNWKVYPLLPSHHYCNFFPVLYFFLEFNINGPGQLFFYSWPFLLVYKLLLRACCYVAGYYILQSSNEVYPTSLREFKNVYGSHVLPLLLMFLQTNWSTITLSSATQWQLLVQSLQFYWQKKMKTKAHRILHQFSYCKVFLCTYSTYCT